jgi:hypothetical protein
MTHSNLEDLQVSKGNSDAEEVLHGEESDVVQNEKCWAKGDEERDYEVAYKTKTKNKSTSVSNRIRTL